VETRLKIEQQMKKSGFILKWLIGFSLGKMHNAAHLVLPFIWFRIGLDLVTPCRNKFFCLTKPKSCQAFFKKSCPHFLICYLATGQSLESWNIQ
jgi:hypothetical protein